MGDVDSLETQHVTHWIAEYKAPWNGLVLALEKLAVKYMGESAKGKLQRAHVNLSNHGDVLSPHQDIKGGVTLLLYANPDKRWNRHKCQGETVFYSKESEEALYTVSPKGGRIIMFGASTKHRSAAPERE